MKSEADLLAAALIRLMQRQEFLEQLREARREARKKKKEESHVSETDQQRD